ncbi:MAG TPA: NAD-dependent epimerase [bacterium]|nr:NAD-dependent epimerase [bacterium]
MKKILITGAAGFIGFHLTCKLLKSEYDITGIDNLNNYYDVKLKEDRLAILKKNSQFKFFKLDLADKSGMSELFEKGKFDIVVNLAAQAGVRYSLKNPYAYIDSNITGFLNVLEGCRYCNIKHLDFASSSSVYGGNANMPFSVHQNVDHPVSLYAATKKANELMAHTYANLYKIPVTGLRFFTVYGPWGRPDMALFLFTKAIINDEPIDVFNYGKMKRDFTYIDDITEGISKIMLRIPEPDNDWDRMNPDPASSFAPYKIYNIGNNNPVELIDFISAIEENLGKKAKKNFLKMQDGDVPATYADVDDLVRDSGFKPDTPVEKGIGKFIKWYKEYYL